MHRRHIAADSTSSSPNLTKSRGIKGTATLHKHPVQVARRNERERRRVHHVNEGFGILRQHIPITMQRSKKLSKVETLRAATQYIQHLQTILEASSRDDLFPSFVKSEFLDSSGYASNPNSPLKTGATSSSEFDQIPNEFDVGLDDADSPASSVTAEWTTNNIPSGYLHQQQQHQSHAGPLSTPVWMNFGQSPSTTPYYHQQQHQVASQSFFNFLPELQFKHETPQPPSSMYC